MFFPTTLVLPFFAVTLVSGNDLSSRIYNGEEYGDELKFLVKIEVVVISTKTYSCSGSIINTNWIMSAAHCVSFPGQVSEARVTHFRSTPVSPALSIGEFFRHPKFIPSPDGTKIPLSSTSVDLVLLRTTQLIQFNQLVEPIFLARSLPQPGPAVVAGYGQPTNMPKKGQITLSYCDGPNNMKPILCSVTRANMPHTGVGDSGGPVVANGILVGVVSGSIDESKIVNRFADIPSNYDWIQSVINKF